MREVVLHGELARLYGKHHLFEVASPAEAVRALCANFPGFEKHMVDSEKRGVGYQVWSGKNNLSVAELNFVGEARIYISPVILGSKQGGLFQTILGAILIVAGIALTFFVPGGAAIGIGLIKIGAVLFIGGIVQLLTPIPLTTGGSDQVTSKFFNGPINTTAQGNPVPIGYGKLLVGSVVISGEITISDIAKNFPTPTGGGGGSKHGQIP